MHERDEDTDLLLMVVRKFMRHTRTACKVILMSATVDVGKFAQYFKSIVMGEFRNAPIVEVDSSEPHPVRVYYFDDLQKLPVKTIFFFSSSKNHSENQINITTLNLTMNFCKWTVSRTTRGQTCF